MKKYLSIALVLFFVCAGVSAATPTLTLLDGASATGVGSSYAVPKAVGTLSNHGVSVFWEVDGGSVTEMTVRLEGSHDGTHFFSLGDHSMSAEELTNKSAGWFFPHAPVDYVRGSITVLTNTGTASITVFYKGADV